LSTEITKVRASLFEVNGVKKEPLVLPEPDGAPVTITEKVFVPVKDHPEVRSRQAFISLSLLRVIIVNAVFRGRDVMSFGKTNIVHETVISGMEFDPSNIIFSS